MNAQPNTSVLARREVENENSWGICKNTRFVHLLKEYLLQKGMSRKKLRKDIKTHTSFISEVQQSTVQCRYRSGFQGVERAQQQLSQEGCHYVKRCQLGT